MKVKFREGARVKMAHHAMYPLPRKDLILPPWVLNPLRPWHVEESERVNRTVVNEIE
ncbi:hypothetical protein BN903_7 [Halorubrum sp. AJ67]|nr:hypothetical protein BN903_7 [Halorubrum sp. AJ67]